MIASDEDYKTLYPVILLLRCKVSPNIPNNKILKSTAIYRPVIVSPQAPRQSDRKAHFCVQEGSVLSLADNR